MYDSIKRSSQIGNERRIIIDEVNPQQRFITGHDSYSKAYRVTFDFHNSVVAIPFQGEMWTISQYQNEWRLGRRVDTGNERTQVTDLAQGDRRLEAPNNLYLNGAKVYINGSEYEAKIAELQAQIDALQAIVDAL